MSIHQVQYIDTAKHNICCSSNNSTHYIPLVGLAKGAGKNVFLQTFYLLN